MKTTITKRIPLALILLIALVFGKLQANKLSGGENEVCTTICSDGRGYYAWLPAVFIYHDLNFNFFEQAEVKDTLCGGEVGGCLQDYRSCHDGVPGNKYYPGAAFMMLPFFLVAHISALSSAHYPADGYSYPYFHMAGLAGIFYYMVGMLFFLAILRKMGLNTLQQSLTIMLVTFGTNIMYYAVDKPTYSHIYSFTLIAAFLYYVLTVKDKYSAWHVLCLSFITGWIFITRPVNVSILLIPPFLYREQLKRLWQTVLAQPARLALLLPGLVMPAILFSMYKIQTGHFFIYSYGDEGFDFLHPKFFAFLFDYNNSVFAYMPLLLMPFLLLPLWYKRNDKIFLVGAAVTILVTFYIHSSWYCWWYGFTFGARTILDFVPLFGMVIGLSLKNAGSRRYAVLLPVYFAAAALTVILYHQKNHGYMNGFPITDYWDAVFNALGVKS